MNHDQTIEKIEEFSKQALGSEQKNTRRVLLIKELIEQLKQTKTKENHLLVALMGPPGGGKSYNANYLINPDGDPNEGIFPNSASPDSWRLTKKIITC
ncbi:ABC transporter ATP-binding protein [Acrasis kona]|uniref:ABC transporter ATP-binding protein n=1 Tax=Acrasis kona TaxID=1008807 RepID=A0AAW2ZFG7_9EUKA